MDAASTDSLRALAPKWSLAGDEQLLNLLQKTHEKIISKCQDVNVKLDEMASSLSNASINLQNVNNKFMALSNSQFIESRVYDDDDVLTTDTAATKDAVEPGADEVGALRRGLAVLEGAHEPAEIIDDSDSDSDVEISVVLKPKDMYADRPLPYIIGSQQWKSKWHAGLIVEDSDTDSSASKRDRETEQFSDTDSEETRPPLDENTLSESGSSLGGSLGAPPSLGVPLPPPSAPLPAPGAPLPASGAPLPSPGAPTRPADIAAELAKRLAVPAQTIPEKEPEESPAPAHVVRKTYRPEPPPTSTIFSDEPPPLDAEESQSSDEDIFAEINKHTPYTQKNPVRNNVTDDLFSFDKPNVEEGDIFSDFAPINQTKSAKQKSTLFEGDSEPELFADRPPQKKVEQNISSNRDEPSAKKPIGGISLFGSGKGAESIGAAILKRNQRKSSSSDEESGNENSINRTDNISKPIVQNKPHVARNYENIDNKTSSNTADETHNTPAPKKEKDIFEDLFSKPDNAQKKQQKINKLTVKKPEVPETSKVKEKEKTNVKDLFSDNIFDDIDDIFTSNVKIPSQESSKSNQKSIFDDDDLFSDISVAQTSQIVKDNKTNVKSDQVSIKHKKSIFDSDDDLFSEVKTDKPTNKSYNDEKSEHHPGNKNGTVYKAEPIKEPTEINKERNLFDDSPQSTNVVSKPVLQSKSIFDSDSDSDNIFAKIQKSDRKKPNKSDDVNNLHTESKKESEEEFPNTVSTTNLLTTDNIASKDNLIQSPSLFEEDEIDNLFIAANKLKAQTIDQKVENIIEEKDNNYIKTPVLVTIPEPATTNTVSTLSKTEHHKNVTEENLPNDNASIDNGLNSPSAKNVGTVEVIESSQDITESDQLKSLIISSKTLKSDLQNNDKETISGKNTDLDCLNTTQDVSNKSDFDEKQTDTLEPKAPILSTDTFDDLFSEPPAFEKPAEPKKSKNVNALFDDDSDDESLFFKKNDGISDEKPEIFSSNANFDIFVNEPPAIDVDFTTKSTKTLAPKNENNSINPVSKLDDLFGSDGLDDEKNTLFTDKSIEKNASQMSKNNSSNELFTNVPKSTDNVMSDKKVSNDDEDLFAFVPEIVNNVPAKEIQVNEDNKPEKPQSSLFDDMEDGDLFTSEKRSDTKTETHNLDVNSDIITKNNVVAKDSDEELFVSLPSLPKNRVNDKPIDDLSSNIPNKNATEDIFKHNESPRKESEAKKIGKLNTKNFNINVNALIPGASPKKVPKDLKSEGEPKMIKIIPDETDFTAKSSNKSESNVIDKEAINTDSEKEKSVTFDEKSESGVLDNNVSKQRARIQVKRRPSSRRARHEAARKSAIDFGDDTDNSSSFDEPRPRKTVIASNYSEEQPPKIISDTEIEQSKATIANINAIESNDNVSDSNKDQEDMKPDKPDQEKKDVTDTQNTNKTKPTTTKIVYILNDEDIFNTDSKKLENDLFESKKGIESKNLMPDGTDDLIKTLGNTYKNAQKSSDVVETDTKTTKDAKTTEKELKLSKKEKSLFDDSDEELFGKKNEVKKKTTIFDSDSEDELFSGKQSKEKNNKEQKNKGEKEKKVILKSSLFSDEDDDDDLFGLKKDNKREFEQKSVPTTSKELSATTTTSKTAEPVFSDPLSMLGNDD